METLEILENLIKINTVADLHNKEIINWIEKYLGNYGFKCKRILDKVSNRMNLVAEIGENPILAFAGHLDTVPASDNWDSNPYELVIKDNIAYGLGICDMKGGIAAFLKASSIIDFNRLKSGLKLYFTFDEEFHFEGIKLLMKSKENIPSTLILAEPTDLRPIIATKGCIDIEVQFFGKTAHSSMLTKGKNAILEANKFMNEIVVLSEEMKQDKNDLFDINHATINIGKIQGGDAINKVPDKCLLAINFRTVDSSQNISIENRIRSILKKYDAKLNIEINLPSKINTNVKMQNIIEKITGKKSGAANYITEASFMNDTDVIILGIGNVAHECNEHIKVDQLNKLVQIYEKIIEYYCY